jgi:hypothetical protein
MGWQGRVQDIDWVAVVRSLRERGNAVLPGLVDRAQCESLAALYDGDLFRSRVVMARHGFGRGEYQYFRYPLPEPVAGLRDALYPPLAAIANAWQAALGLPARYPAAHDAYLAACRAAGQARPTPLLLRYVAGDFNCLHQDLYGELVFPLQVAVLLSRPGVDFEGGEFVMTESDADGQRVDVVPLTQGDAVVFAVRDRPVDGRRGPRRAQSRHGVSHVRSGLRQTLGILFHDAA